MISRVLSWGTQLTLKLKTESTGACLGVKNKSYFDKLYKISVKNLSANITESCRKVDLLFWRDGSHNDSIQSCRIRWKHIRSWLKSRCTKQRVQDQPLDHVDIGAWTWKGVAIKRDRDEAKRKSGIQRKKVFREEDNYEFWQRVGLWQLCKE